MVRYNIEDVTDGMVLGESIFTTDGRLLIAAGFSIRQSHIEQLRRKGIRAVMINVEGTEDVIPESIISHQVESELAATLAQSKKNIDSVFEERRKTTDRVVDIITKDKRALSDLIRNSNLLTVVTKVIDDVLTEPWTMLNVSKMREMNEGFFEYVVSVTVISLCIGHKYRFSPDEMRQLGLGALTYDIGMLAIPPAILNKEDPLTEDETKLLQQHTTYGHLMLADIPSILPTSSFVALAHHECQDGTGYPRGIKSDNRPPLKNLARESGIHRFAEIVAVADAYDIFVHGRKHFGAKLGPVQAIRELLVMRGTKLNADVVKMLISMAPAYPVGTRIRITDSPVPNLNGSIGVISKIDTEHLYEPTILIYQSRSGTPIKPIVVDLAKFKGFSIEALE